MRIRGAMTVPSYLCLPTLGMMMRVVLGLVLSCVVIEVHADTIVLKNGRRIIVNLAKETDDRVTGETDAGQLSLPKSMVERVEHGPVDIPTSANRTISSGNSFTNESAKNIGLAAPTTQSVFVIDERIARAVIHDGSIDHNFIAQLEQAAITGTPDAANRAAAAHEAASAFEANNGNLDAAAEQESEALR